MATPILLGPGVPYCTCNIGRNGPRLARQLLQTVSAAYVCKRTRAFVVVWRKALLSLSCTSWRDPWHNEKQNSPKMVIYGQGIAVDYGQLNDVLFILFTVY